MVMEVSAQPMEDKEFIIRISPQSEAMGGDSQARG